MTTGNRQPQPATDPPCPKCKHDMELQWVCERCGHREAAPQTPAEPVGSVAHAWQGGMVGVLNNAGQTLPVGTKLYASPQAAATAPAPHDGKNLGTVRLGGEP